MLTQGAIEVLALSEIEWRIRDTSIPVYDPGSVLGLVRLIGDTFELTSVGMPLDRYYFGHLQDVVGYLGRDLSA
jgi:hypothetical protein